MRNKVVDAKEKAPDIAVLYIFGTRDFIKDHKSYICLRDGLKLTISTEP